MGFNLSLHAKNILCGKGMCKCEKIDGKKHCRLLCAASNCIYHPTDSSDPDYGRDINVKGYVVCPRCSAKTTFAEGAEWDDNNHLVRIKCKACNKLMSVKNVKWTQYVVSRHRRNRHEYFHEACWEKKFIDIPDEPDEGDSTHFCGKCDDYAYIMRIVKWASKA